jgi:hypothetical protein
MFQRKGIVSVVLIAGVLLGAYGLGLLIRQARTGGETFAPQGTAESNDSASTEPQVPNPRIGRAKPTPEPLAAAKQEKAEELVEVENLTEAERQERREALGAQLRTGSRQPGRVPHLSPQELEEIRERWPQMSEEERAAYRAAIRGLHPAAPNERTTTALPSDPAVEPNAGGANSEPNG